MTARIAVVSPSDSFSEVWPQLASFAGARLEVGSNVGEIRSLQATCGVPVAAGGVEEESIEVLRELQAARSPVAVVAGMETNYRMVASSLQAGAANYFAMPRDLGMCRSWFVDRVERVVDRRNAEVRGRRAGEV